MASAWVNWNGGDDFYLAALNAEKLAVSSVQHLPAFRFETAEEVEEFKGRFADEFAMEHENDEFGPSFADVTVGMDKAHMLPSVRWEASENISITFFIASLCSRSEERRVGKECRL